MSLPRIVILELEAQYSLVIERTLREIGYRAVILKPERLEAWLESHPVEAIILSGGKASVYDDDAPLPPSCIFALRHEDRPVPILGICYGMQWLAQALGGTVRAVPEKSEYGHARVIRQGDDSALFTGTDPLQSVWMSHGDSVIDLPDELRVTAVSTGGTIAAMENRAGTVFGVQFHLEVTHTTEGKRILANFLGDIAGCEQDWEPGSLVSDIQERIVTGIGREERAIFGFSGGVDSTTIAALAAPILGERLLAVTIDGGHLRENELEEIARHAALANVIHLVIDARSEFERVMCDTIDAEEKRKRFKQVYVALLCRVAREFGASIVFQGTLAPDRIESGKTGGALIKSHHNVGLDLGHLKQAHPIDHLFKHEVRALAKELGLPESVWGRQPFPGPGGFLRVTGMPATQDKLAIWQWAQARTDEILKRRGLWDFYSQVVVYLMGTRLVGVKGDARSYAYPAVVRAIKTVDFMTASGVHLDEDTENEIGRTLTRHPEIVRVLFDPNDKPPATTEAE
jgi:GMP synthase (glutamine-hydrolysing)